MFNLEKIQKRRASNLNKKWGTKKFKGIIDKVISHYKNGFEYFHYEPVTDNPMDETHYWMRNYNFSKIVEKAEIGKVENSPAPIIVISFKALPEEYYGEKENP